VPPKACAHPCYRCGAMAATVATPRVSAEWQTSRPCSRPSPCGLPEASCLACAACGQVVCTEDSILRCRNYLTLRKAVYAYELSVLGAPAWCYSVTGPDAERFDIVLLEEVCVGRAPGASVGFGSVRRAAGVVVSNTQAPPSGDNSWFEGFNYQSVRCGGCSSRKQIGWAFTSTSSRSYADPTSSFFGLIITRLRERPLASAKGWTPNPLGNQLGNKRCMQLHSLTANTVSDTSAAAAAGAARGINAMPTHLIPSTSAAGRGIGLPRWQDVGDHPSSPSDSDTEDEDFQAQRRARRRQGRDAELAHRGAEASLLSARGLQAQGQNLNQCQRTRASMSWAAARRRSLPPLSIKSAEHRPGYCSHPRV